MLNVPERIEKRLSETLKKFQVILKNAKDKDVNESDTVTIITDILNDLFGYDKYSEITSEYKIKSNFCDLAIKTNGKITLLIECKAIGLELKDDYIKQAIDYGSNAGIDWVILTNSCKWKIYKIIFAKPVEKELVYEFDLLSLNNRKLSDLEILYYISKEAFSKSALEDLRIQKQTLSKFSLGQLILSDNILDSLRKQLKRMSPDIKVTNDEIKEVITNEVLKREILEDDKSAQAKRRIIKAMKPVNVKSKKENIIKPIQ